MQAIYTPEEMNVMALRETLVRAKVTDNPVQFLQENTVKHTAIFRTGVAMAVVITEITPNPQVKK
jgi:hypothetical protein